MTPTLSVDAVQPSVMLVCVTLDVVSAVGAVGFVVSGQADVVPEMIELGDVLPAASLASTERL
jgi:hypothetical protein